MTGTSDDSVIWRYDMMGRMVIRGKKMCLYVWSNYGKGVGLGRVNTWRCAPGI